MNEPRFETETGDRLPLHNGSVIGRTPSADLTFAYSEVSRNHASIELRSEMWWLTDLGSKNGTFVNGRAVTNDPVRLADGDSVVLAGVVTLVFRDPAATPMAPRIGQLTGVWIDPVTGGVWVDAVLIEPPLSSRQLDLLRLLNERCDAVVSRSEIVERVWAEASAAGVTDDAVTALVKRLRARLREGPRGVDYIDIVKGRGIRLRSGP